MPTPSTESLASSGSTRTRPGSPASAEAAVGSAVGFVSGDGDREPGVARGADVLHDHVDVDAGLGDQPEDPGGVAGPVGDVQQRDAGLLLVQLDAGDDQVLHPSELTDTPVVGDDRASRGGRCGPGPRREAGRAIPRRPVQLEGRDARPGGLAAAEARSTRTLILISLVVIIWMLMPASARASNIVCGHARMDLASPGRRPRPWRPRRRASRPRRPMSLAACSATISVSARSLAGDGEADLRRAVGGDVLDDHVDDDVRLGDRPEQGMHHARPVGHAQDRHPRLVLRPAPRR